MILICLWGCGIMTCAHNAAHSVATISASGQLLRIIDKRSKYDNGDADEEDKQAENAGTSLQRSDDHLEARIIVEELKKAHDSHRTEQIPGRMHFIVAREDEIAVDEVTVEPDTVEQVDPVDNVLEKLDSIRRNQAFDDEFEREPRNAHVLDVVENGGHSLAAVHREIENAMM